MATTLNIRGIHASHAAAIKAAAQARSLTLAQYLGRLVLLHVAVREEAARGDVTAIGILRTLALETVTT